ncbi:MAG: hypothetical protein IPH31_24525 [Lewinellaceae bacterium]|nr:hypothetical protein [Lewinellaceae bacterium]
MLSFSLFLIGLVACDKDKTTVINGKVVDKITGAPLDEAFVEFWISHDDVPAPNNYEPVIYTQMQMGNLLFNQMTELVFTGS